MRMQHSRPGRQVKPRGVEVISCCTCGDNAPEGLSGPTVILATMGLHTWSPGWET